MRYPISLIAAGLLSVFATGRPAVAGLVNEAEPNDTIATADNVDGQFSTAPNLLVDDGNGNNTSTVIPYVSYLGQGQVGGADYDFLSFTVDVVGTRGVFDVDMLTPGVDTALYLFDDQGNLISQNDDSTGLDTGSNSTADPFLRHTFAAAGLYVLGIAGAGSTAGVGGITGPGLDPGALYFLNVSLNAVPEPTSLLLFGAGTASLVWHRRKKRKLEQAGAETPSAPVAE